MDEKTWYDKALKTIVRTRLLFNSKKELGEYIGFSLNNNGISKVKNTFQQKAIYAELESEFNALLNDGYGLTRLLADYEQASLYYANGLDSWLAYDTEHRLIQLIEYRYGTAELPDDKTARRLFIGICDKAEIDRRNVAHDYDAPSIDVACIVLMAMGILPGFAAKRGDVRHLRQDIDALFDFVDRLFEGDPTSMWRKLPLAARLRQMMIDDMDEPAEGVGYACRAFLIYALRFLLERYRAITHPQLYQQVIDQISTDSEPLDLEGIWMDADSTVTAFWRITDAVSPLWFLENVVYEVSARKARIIRYLIQLYNNNQSMVLHQPWVIKKLTQHEKWGMGDLIDYEVTLRGNPPDTLLALKADMVPTEYNRLHLRRATEEDTKRAEAVIAHYDVENVYPDCDYQFELSLYAITHDSLWLQYEDKLLTIPLDRNPEFENASLNDRIGILTIGERTYVVYDERQVYIDITDWEAVEAERGMTFE